MLLNKRCIVSFSSFSPTAVLATKSRTFDPSFSSCSDISLHNYKTNKTTTLDQDLRFNTVLWCESPSYSFLSTGQENGTFQIFKHYDDTLHPYYTNSTHLTGDITGMSYNHSKHLLSIGGSSSKIILYDINTPDKPFLAPQIKPDTFHISSLSFNPKVSHILCAGTTTGSIVVLDLRQKKEVLRISHPHLQHITQILWHPLSTTSILASSPTSILSFDLSTDTTTTLVTTKYLNTFSIHNSNSDNPFLLYTTPTSITTQPLSISTNTSTSNNTSSTTNINTTRSNNNNNIPFTTPSNNISDLQLSTYTPLLSSISYTDGKTLLTNILNIHNTPYITPYNNSNLTVTSYNLYSYDNKCYNIYKLPKIYMSSDINKNTLIYRIYSIMLDSDKGSNVLDKGKGLCRDVRKRIGDLIFSEYNKDRLESDNDMDILEEGDNDGSSKQQGVNDSSGKQHPLINSTNKQHPINTTSISFDLKDVITLSLLKGDFINAYDLSYKSKEQHPLIYTILLCMNKEEIKVKIKELRNKTKNDKIHLLLCVLCNEYKYLVDNVVLEQWYVVLYLLCYIDVCYDEYSELLTILGDRLSNSDMLGGVNDKVSSVKGYSTSGVKGVSNSTSKEEGVNNSTSKEKGVNYKDNEQHPLNNSTKEQHPLNNSTKEQHPINNSTNDQHPLNNNTYTYYSLICYLLSGNLKKYFDVRNNEFEIPKSVFKVIETLKKYGSVVGECYTMGGVNDSILMREYSKYSKVSYKDRVEGVSSKVCKMEVRGVSGKSNEVEGVSNSTSGLKGVIEPTNALHPFNNNTYKQQGVSINDYKQQGVSNTPYKQHPFTLTPPSQHPFTPSPQHPVTPSIPKPLTRQYTPPTPNTSNTSNIPTSSIPSMPSANTPSIPPSNIPAIPPTTNIPTKPHTYGQLRNSKTYGQLTSKITPPLNTSNTTPFNNKEDNIRTTGYTKPIDTNISSSIGSGYVKPLNRPVPVYNKPISPPLSTSSNIGVSSTNTYPSPPPTNPSPTTNTTTNINNNPPHTNTTDIINTIDKRVLLIKRLASKKKGLIYKNKINECLRRLECYNNINKNDIPIDILNKLKEVLYIVSEEEVLLCEEEKRLCDLRDVWYEKVRCVCEDIVRCYGGVKGVDVWVLGIVGLLQIGLSDRG